MLQVSYWDRQANVQLNAKKKKKIDRGDLAIYLNYHRH